MTKFHLLIPVLALALVLPACGSSDDESSSSTTTAAAAAKKPATLPEELVGTWTTTLRKSDVPPKRPISRTPSA